jgi:hypothetical protein
VLLGSLAVGGLAALTACDLGPFDNQASVGKAVLSVTANLSSYTVDQPIVLTANRFLDPLTVVRQSLQLEDSGGNLVTEPLVAYDPVTLTISISNPGGGLPWLTAGQQYRIVLPVPTTGDGGLAFGLTAIDGAPLAAAQTITFMAGAAPSSPAAAPPTIDFCRDIMNPIFATSCGYGGCHEAAQPVPASIDAGSMTGYPRLGLDLSSAAGVLATAINQVADESNTGALAQANAELQGAPFGINMARIAPGQPASSWLLYKTLLAIPAAPSAEAVPFDAGADAGDAAVAMNHSDYGQTLTSPVSTAERAVLSNYILGQSMPYPGPATAEPSVGLTQGDLERLSLWIAQGAQTPSSCP